jgi:hypothetical protein
MIQGERGGERYRPEGTQVRKNGFGDEMQVKQEQGAISAVAGLVQECLLPVVALNLDPLLLCN